MVAEPEPEDRGRWLSTPQGPGITPRSYSGGSQPAGLNLDEPVIVLTCARSGSTLLRLILDAHPDLACPPETNIVKICAQLASVCSVLEDLSPGPRQPTAAPEIVHAMMNAVFADYLHRQGKIRWCEKSLGTVDVAESFLKIYPKAKFICLYRHCMDVIDSALEATPWGLNGYGFDSFAASSPGNNIAALAAYWCEYAGRIITFEETHPGQCLRVYYEELTADPERTAEEIFSFIGVASVPGVTARYRAGGSHLTGPGDHKVGATTVIDPDSVGRGIRVPVDLIHPAHLQMVNGTLARLGYAEIDNNWRKALRPPCLLPGRGARVTQANTSAATIEPSYESCLLNEIGKVVRARINPRLGPYAAASLLAAGAIGPRQTVGIAAYGKNTIRSWRIDIDRALITENNHGDIADIDWLLTGDIGTWSAVLCGYENFSASMRSRAIRYVDLSDDQPENNAHDTRPHVRANVIQELLAPVEPPIPDPIENASLARSASCEKR